MLGVYFLGSLLITMREFGKRCMGMKKNGLAEKNNRHINYNLYKSYKHCRSYAPISYVVPSRFTRSFGACPYVCINSKPAIP